MTSASRLYRIGSGILCGAFALVGALFVLAPGAVLSLFDRWSSRLGLATSAGAPAGLFVALAGAYMVVVTALAYSMYRDPRDAASPRLLVQAKLASAALSLGFFVLRQPHLVLLVNGIVDGGIGLLVLLLRRRLDAATAALEPTP